MRVTVRERKVKDGKISFYLDVVGNGQRKQINLGIQIDPNQLSRRDLGKRRIAERLRDKVFFALKTGIIPEKPEGLKDLITKLNKI